MDSLRSWHKATDDECCRFSLLPEVRVKTPLKTRSKDTDEWDSSCLQPANTLVNNNPPTTHTKIHPKSYLISFLLNRLLSMIIHSEMIAISNKHTLLSNWVFRLKTLNILTVWGYLHNIVLYIFVTKDATIQIFYWRGKCI